MRKKKKQELRNMGAFTAVYALIETWIECPDLREDFLRTMVDFRNEIAEEFK